MARLKNVIMEHREIKGERLELTDKDSLYFLGPQLTLNHCNVSLKTSASHLLLLTETRFIDCSIEIKRELKNHDWSYAFLKGCRFNGPLSGCDFGHRLPQLSGRENGGIEDCDFTDARLDGCRFHGCDAHTLKFPSWPCFTFLDPIGRAPELLRVEWPGLFGEIIVELFPTEPPSTAAMTFHAPGVAKRLKTTPEELRAILETLDCVIL